MRNSRGPVRGNAQVATSCNAQVAQSCNAQVAQSCNFEFLRSRSQFSSSDTSILRSLRMTGPHLPYSYLRASMGSRSAARVAG
jgi:hypothetical protein